jgi:1,4-dihydroxy-2-naphthoate polyprenyltransferase
MTPDHGAEPPGPAGAPDPGIALAHPPASPHMVGDLSTSPPSRLVVWTLAARPKTLWAAVAPVLVGTALAVEAGAAHAPAALSALVAALLIQIGTNFSNDYADFLKGADTHERKGPLRVTQAGLVAPATMKRATALVFTLAVVAGLYLIYRGGWPVLAIGVLSIAAGILYTSGRYALAYVGLGDLFVLVFFGPVAVGGTYYVQALDVGPEVLAIGLAPGLLAVAILLANNIRDVDEDRLAGKRTLVVRMGKSTGVAMWLAAVVVAALIPPLVGLAAGEHPAAALTLLILPLAIPPVRTLRSSERDALNPVLGQSARLLLTFSVLFALGWNL